jgi:hypothetical protein
VFAFALYAIAVWYAAAKFRRQWRGFLWIALAAVGLVLVGFFHWQLNIWTHGRIYLRVLQVLLYPYSILVIVIALYIACLPRRAAAARCSGCGYEFTGISALDAVCPECGAERTEPVVAGVSRGTDATPGREAV